MNSEQKKLINLSVHESSNPEMLERDAESKTGTKPNTQASSDDKPEIVDESDVIFDERRAEQTLNVASPNAAAVQSGITEI